MARKPPHHQSHKEQLQNQAEEEKDAYETAIEASGCAKFHFALQDCYFEHNDWRKCRKEMDDFKLCVNKQTSSNSSRE